MGVKTSAVLARLAKGMDEVVLMRHEAKHLLMVSLISQGHLLIEGLPGTAKTHLSRTFASLMGGEFKRIQGTPDMLPADILGFYLYRPDSAPTFMPGPIFANTVMVDELNRLSPRTQSALLEAMQEGQVTIEGQTHPLPRPFIVVASQVPFGGQGTSLITDVQADRFMFRVWHGYPSFEEEDSVIKNIDCITETAQKAVITLQDILFLQQEALRVHVADEVRRYAIKLTQAVREHPDVIAGPSIRSSLALFKGARASALMQNRSFAIPDDIKVLALPAFFHRVHLKPEAEAANTTVENVIKEVLSLVPVPRV
jgi:MoxR-like ATPase